MADPARPPRVPELLGLIEAAWADLLASFEGYDEAALTRPGREGWSVKDHLAHVTRWEHVARTVYLEGRPFAEAAGMDEATARATEHMRAESGLNDWFHARDRDLTLAQTLERLQASHTALVARIEATPWARLEPVEVGSHVAGNTFEHYREHSAHIRGLLGATPPLRPSPRP
ncbi:MAG: ClbS/DfsB family four-helix bundle protein [Dehalococcoidia bacterium]|nr:ClbS/DfsB family four-helix bundle protein [Dehalococcoidia bacterium]